jgi:drug/metabolite transporter (DMT)-like permease
MSVDAGAAGPPIVNLAAAPRLHAAPLPGRDWLMLGLLSFLWGGSFFFYKLLAPVLPPFTLVLGRVLIAALALHLVLLLRGQALRLTPKLIGWFLLLGTLNCALPFCLFAWSEARLTSGLAAILNAPTPIATALVAHFATRDEKLTTRMVIGALCGLAGIAVLIGPDLMHGLASANLTAELACLAAGVAYAFGGVLSRKVHGVPPLQLATGQLSGATIVILPFAVIGDRFWTLPPLPASGWAALLGIALLSTSLAYLMYFRILASSGATRAALVTFLVPISALLLGGVFLGEQISLRALAGILTIGLGLAVIDGRLLRLFRNRTDATSRG